MAACVKQPSGSDRSYCLMNLGFPSVKVTTDTSNWIVNMPWSTCAHLWKAQTGDWAAAVMKQAMFCVDLCIDRHFPHGLALIVLKVSALHYFLHGRRVEEWKLPSYISKSSNSCELSYALSNRLIKSSAYTRMPMTHNHACKFTTIKTCIHRNFFVVQELEQVVEEALACPCVSEIKEVCRFELACFYVDPDRNVRARSWRTGDWKPCFLLYISSEPEGGITQALWSWGKALGIYMSELPPKTWVNSSSQSMWPRPSQAK